jgi:hypothetical protein
MINHMCGTFDNMPWACIQVSKPGYDRESFPLSSKVKGGFNLS